MQWVEKPVDCFQCGRWAVYKSAIHGGKWVYAYSGIPRGATTSLHIALSEAERLQGELIAEEILIIDVWRL